MLVISLGTSMLEMGFVILQIMAEFNDALIFAPTFPSALILQPQSNQLATRASFINHAIHQYIRVTNITYMKSMMELQV